MVESGEKKVNKYHNYRRNGPSLVQTIGGRKSKADDYLSMCMHRGEITYAKRIKSKRIGRP